MVFTSPRVNPVIEMKVEDHYTQRRRGRVHLQEKGGTEHDVPWHHSLEKYLDEFIAAGIVDDPSGPLFRTLQRDKARVLMANPRWQQDAYRMIQRRAEAAGIKTKMGNHSFRVTGIIAYPKNGGHLEHAQQIANHSSPRTTKRYDRRHDEISLDEVERFAI